MAGAKSQNSQAIDFQKQQAAEAKVKEAQRQARLTQGQEVIDRVYGGAPVMRDVSKRFDWAGFKPPAAGETAANIPAGYTATQVAAPTAPATAAGRRAAMRTTGRGTQAAPWSPDTGNPDRQGIITPQAAAPVGTVRPAAASKMWALKGPGGQTFTQGTPFDYTAQEDTGQRTGGFNDEFYNKYRTNYLNLYNPEEQRQHDIAGSELGFNLARAGLGRSSVAAAKQGELEYQDALQKAKIFSDADIATAGLRSDVDKQKQAVISQLYATEDPTLAQNLASSSAKGIQLQNPTLTPGTAFFDPAISAVGGFFQNATSPYGRPPSVSGPSVSSATSSRQRTYS